MNLIKIPPFGKEGAVHAIVEAPRGSGLKLVYDPDLHVFRHGKTLPAGLTYPYDWGFVPGTRAPDGDPVDALVITDVPSHPGVLIPCKLLGVVELSQKKETGKGRERNDRLIMVPNDCPRFSGLGDSQDLPRELRKEIEQFFLDTTFFSDKAAKVLGWKGHKAAKEVIKRGVRALKKDR